MRSVEEQMAEIHRRRRVYSGKRQLRRLSLMAACIGILLIAVLIYAPVVKGAARAGDTGYFGATILGPEAGGYVIVAILSFILGMIITLITQKKKETKER